MKSVNENKLQFVFTEDAFRVDTPDLEVREKDRELKAAFLKNRYKALFALAFEKEAEGESQSLSFLRFLSGRFFKDLISLPELEVARSQVSMELFDESVDEIIRAVPYGIGTENIGRAWIALMYSRLLDVYRRDIEDYDGTVQLYFTEKSQDIRVPERIFFHLVESREEETPFAFMATYATRDTNGVVRHMPLSYALTEFKTERDKLLMLLSCLNKVADVSQLMGELIENGDLFHPLRFSADEAFEFLKAVPAIEKCGVLCRVPNWWKRRTNAVSVKITLGEEKPSIVGFEGLVSMKPSLVVDGEELSEEEIRQMLGQTEGLAYLKGRWVEVDHARLKELIRAMKKYDGQLSVLDAMKMEAGLDESEVDFDIGFKISNGKWLGDLLSKLRRPSSMRSKKVPDSVNAQLRHYQKSGYNWLLYMRELGFGACLADDMGLGKTVQVLAFLEKMRKENKKARVLLIVPASLLGNWEKEAEKFTPNIAPRILHGGGAKKLDEAVRAEDHFLNITTYGLANRMESLREIEWDCLILDEAQAIKNPGTKQTRAIKSIKARQKIAMTGTPIENELGNLWSLFDFLNKGLLGSSKEFIDFTKSLETHREGYQRLKNMVSPFILRRVKTDPAIIKDLPEKIEQIEYVSLSKKQIVLYRRLVKQLEDALNDDLSGMQRRGMVLSYITKLKQICNHPDQYLGQETFDPAESGKFEMLREICETIYEKRERVLVFTQYREITDQLARFLETVFKSPGLVLHGGTRVKRRSEMVEEFNGEEYVPFMILSVKAGGTGLNLTAANHVIHFDRWWNPAVENQATDRAFRIGQKKNVMVHKFVSAGTIEERIDSILNSKKELSDSVIGDGGEKWITELTDAQLLDMMRLRL